MLTLARLPTLASLFNALRLAFENHRQAVDGDKEVFFLNLKCIRKFQSVMMRMHWDICVCSCRISLWALCSHYTQPNLMVVRGYRAINAIHSECLPIILPAIPLPRDPVIPWAALQETACCVSPAKRNALLKANNRETIGDSKKDHCCLGLQIRIIDNCLIKKKKKTWFFFRFKCDFQIMQDFVLAFNSNFSYRLLTEQTGNLC